MTLDPRSPRELYDTTAKAWIRTQPLSLSDFTGRPPVLEMCQPVRGLDVLDLGCGEGYCARQLRKQGAARVVGVDLSSAMIDAARAQEASDQLGITYLVSDATNLSAFESDEFDRVLAMFLFNYVSVEQTKRICEQVFRLLKPSGRFVFAVPHPSLPWLKEAEPPFFFDPGKTRYFSGRDGRFPGKIWKRDGSALDVQMCHKTFEDYFEALGSAGFRTLPCVRELRVTPEILEVDPEFFTPLLDIPLHLAISVSK